MDQLTDGWTNKSMTNEKNPRFTTFFQSAIDAFIGRVPGAGMWENKVIRPKLRASAFSQKVGQTDRQTDWNFQNDP